MPKLIENFIDPTGIYDTIRNDAPWVNRSAPRDECFMALDTTRTYSYGKSASVRRTYTAAPMHPIALSIMEKINETLDSKFNIVVLNYYEGQHNHLGWHADDSPEQDSSRPIAVVSFGAARYIYVRENGFKGTVPDENKFLLTPGSLFVMPPGFQDTHQHKIPKHDTFCGGRISFTYRKLDR